MDKETIIREIQRIAHAQNTLTISRSEFKSKSDISEWQIYKYFESWNDAVEAAGLTPTDMSRIENADLFQEMKAVFVKYGGVCGRMKFSKLCKYSVDVYKKRFGKWNDILLAFKTWLTETREDFPFLNQLPSSPSITTNEASPLTNTKINGGIPSWERIGATTYGSFLNFRGLQHAPVNEQGVVFLFGMVCFELGFIIEAVRTSYPDCEAKRRVNRKRDEWERVRIEFEYLSSNFREHGHNIDGCDVIVCWKHDWLECPLEVIELKTAIQSLAE